jgi:RTX calcium-binding nonapeptide repeat (4 copies)
MDMHAISGTRRRGLAVTGAVALGVVVGLPAQAAFAADGTPSASVTNNTLTVEGTNGNDSIAVLLGGDPTVLQVDLGDGALPLSFDRATFTAIKVTLGRGDDAFTVSPGSALTTEDLDVDGGAGDDTITGSGGADTLIGGPGDDAIQGGDGDDIVFGDGGADVVDGQRGTDSEFLGGGRDTAVWNPGEGSDSIDGGAGRDSLVFNGSNAGEKLALTASGATDVLTRDVGQVRMDMTGVEALAATTIGGADTFATGDLSGTDLGDVDVALAATGGAGDGQVDAVTVAGTDRADRVNVDTDGSNVTIGGLPSSLRISGSEPADKLQLDTGAGNDRVDVSDAARAAIAVAVDLGAGQR